MMATINCKICKTKLAEISKPVISEYDMEMYSQMFLCDCGSSEMEIITTGSPE